MIFFGVVEIFFGVSCKNVARGEIIFASGGLTLKVNEKCRNDFRNRLFCSSFSGTIRTRYVCLGLRITLLGAFSLGILDIVAWAS